MTCRICLEPGDLISVCNCDGTSKWVHEECIKKWVSIRRKNTCEICHGEYTLDSLKPMVDEVSKKKHSYFVFIFTLIVSSSHAFQLWFGAETFNNDPAPAAVGAVIKKGRVLLSSKKRPKESYDIVPQQIARGLVELKMGPSALCPPYTPAEKQIYYPSRAGV